MVNHISNRELQELFEFIKSKKNVGAKDSYTYYLLQNPEKLVEKINEESFEVIIEVLKKNKKKLVKESADLIYHLLVAWIYNEIDEVWEELEKENLIRFQKRVKEQMTYDKNNIFAKILKRDISVLLIKIMLAFNDISPKAPVHILIIQKKYQNFNEFIFCNEG